MRVLAFFLKILTNDFRIFGVLAIGLFSLILAAFFLNQGYSQTRESTQSAVGILSFNGNLRIDGKVAWGNHGQSKLPIIYNGTRIYLQNGTATLELLMGGVIKLCEESNLTVQEIHSPYLFTLHHGSIIFDLPNSAGDIFFTPDFLIKIKSSSDSRTHYKGKIQVDQDGTICVTSEKGPLVVETQDQSSMFDISPGSGITIQPGKTPSFRGPENCVCKNKTQSIDSENLSSAVQNSDKFSQKEKLISFLRKLLKILTFGIV
ncbi:MAG: hypothetical protein MK025_00985 [Acidobacteriia bacterium]|nr:hypothetical protein [Terriglobia bacterium]